VKTKSHFKGFLFHGNVTEIVEKEFTPDEFLPNFYLKFDCLEIPKNEIFLILYFLVLREKMH